MKLERTVRFKKAWQELNEIERELARKALGNLVTDMRYPSLRVKRMQGAQSLWEARVSHSLRLTFEIQADTIILRNIGRHDETLGRP